MRFGANLEEGGWWFGADLRKVVDECLILLLIINKARNEKKTGGKPDSPPKDDSKYNHRAVLGKPHSGYFLLRLNNPRHAMQGNSRAYGFVSPTEVEGGSRMTT
ncbi:hypothetical protein CFP56_041087 [Quercus suber]|uniref:Uncharacterized protein n=1 Tax=Quercus suber TaxID=58331 RepID=A0AAW0IWM1_QUESU